MIIEHNYWGDLPAEILRIVAKSTPDAANLRLVCKSWHAALPPGSLGKMNLWNYDTHFGRALCPSTSEITINAPLADSKSLKELSSTCPSLQNLTLKWATLGALRAAAPGMGNLKELRVNLVIDTNKATRVSDESWLDWVAPMENLASLSISAAKEFDLGNEKGLTTLTILRNLQFLRINNCALVTDASIPVLKEMKQLTSLDLQPSNFSPEGVASLGAPHGPPDLTELSISARKCSTALAAMACSQLNTLSFDCAMPSEESTAFWETSTAAVIPANLSSFALTHRGTFNIVPASFFGATPLHNLQSLRLAGFDLGSPATSALGSLCPNLRELAVKLHHSVRDESLLTWTSLTGLTSLKLRGNWFLSEAAVSTVLGCMPEMQELTLQQLQLEVFKSLAPIPNMSGLRKLKVTVCRLAGVSKLDSILVPLGGSLHELSLRWAGSANDLAAALTRALPHLLHLTSLQIDFSGPVDRGALELLIPSIIACSALKTLKCGINAHRFAPQRPPFMEDIVQWNGLAGLTRLVNLTMATNLGWGVAANTAICAAATNIQKLVVNDTQGNMTNEWFNDIGKAPRLMDVRLGGCQKVNSSALTALHGATALTQLGMIQCPDVGLAAMESLRASVPTLVMGNLYN